MFPISNQNLLIENPPLPNNDLNCLMNIDVVQTTNTELQYSKEKPQLGLNVQEQQQYELNLQEQHNQVMFSCKVS